MIDKLNKYLPLEFSAHLRYAGHASVLQYHGYNKLAEKYAEEVAEELGHANKIMWRIQQLGGFPEYVPKLVGSCIGKWDIEKLLISDLDTEQFVLKSLKPLIEAAEVNNDYETGEVLRGLVRDTEDHVTWLTQQVSQLKELGVANYLQAQL
jgi:bacterioferritin